MQHPPPPQLGTLIEQRLKRTIIDICDEASPGWNALPAPERYEISDVLKKLSRDVLKKRFLADRAMIQ